jgi:histone acetyltransferase (RNA polymerase elongator complex component)
MSKKQITIPIFIPHMGCPHRCIFCNQWKTSGSKVIPEAKAIKEKIEVYLSKRSETVERTEIAFFGGSFTGMPLETQRELLLIASDYKKRRMLDAIRLSTRPDYIDAGELEFLKYFGVDTIELGVQSFSDYVLAASNRGHSADQAHDAIELVKKYGFKLVIQLMPGLPEDSEEGSIRSASLAATHKPDQARIYPAVVLANTGLAELYHQKKYAPLEQEEAIELCKKMLLIFNENNIPVIRIGIHPLDLEGEQDIIAGPYHPAFGFLVRSRMQRDVMESGIIDFLKVNSSRPVRKIDIVIPYKTKEECIGMRKTNIDFLKKRFNPINIDCRVSKTSDDIEINYTG